MGEAWAACLKSHASLLKWHQAPKWLFKKLWVMQIFFFAISIVSNFLYWVLWIFHISCRIFTHLTIRQSFRASSGFTHSSPKLTTWSQKSRSLSWLPPPLYFWIHLTSLRHSTMYISKHHLVPKLYLYLLQISRF